MFEFSNPQWFWLLLIIPFFVNYSLFYKKKRQFKIKHTRMALLKMAQKRNSLLEHLPLIFRSLTLLFIIIALAGPRTADREEVVHGEGVDIVMVIDVSGSMQALDFKPDNRLEAAKQVAANFVKKRRNDRIGLVAFAPYAYTICPITYDHNTVLNILKNLDFPKDPNGTAIGMGLATAVSRLKDSEADSKVVVLITDGLNNTGEIDPITAAHLAKLYDIRVYPIAIGTDKEVDFPVRNQLTGAITYRRVIIDFDIDTLHKIAEITGTNRAWHAETTSEFQDILSEIDELEKHEFKHEFYYRYDDKFTIFILLAMIFVIIEFVFRTIIIRKLP